MDYLSVTLGWRQGGQHQCQMRERDLWSLLRDWHMCQLSPGQRGLAFQGYPTKVGRAIVDLSALVIVVIVDPEAPT